MYSVAIECFRKWASFCHIKVKLLKFSHKTVCASFLKIANFLVRVKHIPTFSIDLDILIKFLRN